MSVRYASALRPSCDRAPTLHPIRSGGSARLTVAQLELRVHLLSRCEDGSVRIWDAATRQLEATLAPGLQRVHGLGLILRSWGWSHRCGTGGSKCSCKPPCLLNTHKMTIGSGRSASLLHQCCCRCGQRNKGWPADVAQGHQRGEPRASPLPGCYCLHEHDSQHVCTRRVVICSGVGALMLHISRVEKAAPAPPTPVKAPKSPSAAETASAGTRWMQKSMTRFFERDVSTPAPKLSPANHRHRARWGAACAVDLASSRLHCVVSAPAQIEGSQDEEVHGNVARHHPCRMCRAAAGRRRRQPAVRDLPGRGRGRWVPARGLPAQMRVPGVRGAVQGARRAQDLPAVQPAHRAGGHEDLLRRTPCRTEASPLQFRCGMAASRCRNRLCAAVRQ